MAEAQENGAVSGFKDKSSEMKIKCEDFIEVYCKCRMPEIVGVDMVQCGMCSEWFHVHCVHVPSEAWRKVM